MTRDPGPTGRQRRRLPGSDANTKSYYWSLTADGVDTCPPECGIIGTKAKGNKTTDRVPTRPTRLYRQGMTLCICARRRIVKRTPDADPEPKFAGVMISRMPDWDWWIGTGFFYDDINAAFMKLVIVLGSIPPSSSLTRVV